MPAGAGDRCCAHFDGPVWRPGEQRVGGVVHEVRCTERRDTGAGTIESPFRSVQKLSDSLSAGQTGCLRGGSYSTSGTLYFRGAATTVMSYPGERAAISGYSEVNRGADGVTLKHMNFTSTGLPMTVRIYGNGTIFEANDITNKHMSGAGACIGVGGSEDHPRGVIIRLNKIHDCGSNADNLNHGIYAHSFSDLIIRDNLFWMNGGYNIQLYPNGERAVVSHNVIDGSREYSIRGAIIIDGYTAVSHIIEQNVIVNVPATTAAVAQRTGSGHVARSNCFYDNAAGNISGSALSQSDNLIADPRFANRTAHDYRLAADSPCLAKVGYDTAALVAGALAAPLPPPLPLPPPPTLNVAPIVTLTSPTDGSAVTPGKVLLRATATDDRAVASVSFSVDGQLKSTDTTAPYAASWNVPRRMRGYHVITATASDADGVTAQASATDARVAVSRLGRSSRATPAGVAREDRRILAAQRAEAGHLGSVSGAPADLRGPGHSFADPARR
jgi:hypothetical protein